MKRFTALLLLLSLLAALPAFAGEEALEEVIEFVDLDAEEGQDPLPAEAAPEAPETEYPAREAFIDDLIACGRQVYDKAGGKLQRAHYASDIYVCKNFTVYIFRQTRGRYRMAEFPDVPLKIPDNLPKKDCKPYSYGYAWKEMSPEEGNPFCIAAQFLYDKSLSKEENMELALAFMRQVRRGDYFQMSAKYEHGNGAHSAVMIADYDPETDTVHWMDSNMAGKKINGIRYGKVQFNAEKEIGWWAAAFCQKGRGATIYRLRDDIIYAEGEEP